jgi:hypothetical protein
MTEPTETQSRLSIVAAKQAEAALLLFRTNHDAMKEQVRLASRDLGEVVTWLNEPNAESQRAIMNLVDVILYLATSRLALVETVLETHGPDASLIG